MNEKKRDVCMFEKITSIPLPEQFKQEYPLPPAHQAVKAQKDEEIRRILMGEDDRFLLIIGPCSANDPDAVCDYVSRLARVQEKIKDKIMLIPRVYTNKPRTNGQGYKGIMLQPDPESAPNISEGIIAIRKMHLRTIAESHLTAADEMLYPENFIYIDDLLSYHAVGARSVENQQHRLTASGVDAPVGMKNPTSGDLTVLFNSIVAAQSAHTFLYRQEEVKTKGNPLSHVILRGSVNRHGESQPNYHYEDLMKTARVYEQFELENPAIIVDINHANSDKQHDEQPRIAKEILYSRRYNPGLHKLIKGLMIESYIEGGAQKVYEHIYGKSITDPCLGWDASEQLMYEIAEKL